MLSPLGLLTIPPEEMIEEVLNTLEGSRRLTCVEFIIRNETWKLANNLRELTGTIKIWSMAESN